MVLSKVKSFIFITIAILIYEKNIILTVEAGKIINKKIIDNTQKEIPALIEPEKQGLEK